MPSVRKRHEIILVRCYTDVYLMSVLLCDRGTASSIAILNNSMIKMCIIYKMTKTSFIY